MGGYGRVPGLSSDQKKREKHLLYKKKVFRHVLRVLLFVPGVVPLLLLMFFLTILQVIASLYS